MASTKFTVAAGGSTANGLSALFRIVPNAAPPVLQTGATATQTGAAAHETSITTTTAGARCYMAAVNFTATAYTADANTSGVGQFTDATNAREYTGGRQTQVVATPGATTLGFTAPTDNGGLAVAEILPIPGISLVGTLDISIATPNKTNGTSVTSNAAAIPDGGALIIALISANGGAGQTTMAVSDSLGLTWTELVRSNTAGAGYAGVWVAYLPAPPAQNAWPGQTWQRMFQHRQMQPPPSQRFVSPLNATVTTTATEQDTVGKALAGTVTTTGTEQNAAGKALAATATTAGALQNTAGKALKATTATTGALTRAAGKALTATAATTGATVRAVGKALTSTVSSVGGQKNSTGKTYPVTVVTTGALAHGLTRALNATVTTTASVARTVGKTLAAAAVNTAGSLLRAAGKALKATVTTVASIFLPSPPPAIHHATITITPAGPLAAQVSVTAAVTVEATVTAAGNGAASVTITPN